jgi:hypothetical protein
MGAKAVIGIVKNEAQAERILNELRTAGFSPNDISVLFPDKQGTRDFAHEKGTKMPEGAATGAATGGLLGGGVGWLVGLGFPEYEAKQYEAKLREGNLLISVHTEDMAERSKAKEVFDRNHVEGVGTQGEEKVRKKA